MSSLAPPREAAIHNTMDSVNELIDRETLSKLAAEAYENVLNGKLPHLNPFDAIADAVLPVILSQTREIERLKQMLKLSHYP